MTDLLIVICIVLDQVSKYFAAASLQHDITVIPGFFYLTYVQNTGAAWSAFSDSTTILTMISALAVCVMVFYYRRYVQDKITRFALALMIGGAIGNFIDRFLLHYVRDFLHFYIFSYDFPVFNVADVALSVGVVLLIIAALKGEKHAA